MVAAAGDSRKTATLQGVAPTLQALASETKQSKAKTNDKTIGKAKANLAQIQHSPAIPHEPVLGAPFADRLQALVPQYPKALWQALKQAWENRPHGFRLTTPGYQAAQLRMLPLLLVSAAEQSKVFLDIHQKSGILFSSVSTYWTAFATLQASMSRPKSTDHGKVQKHLEKMAMTETHNRISCSAEEIAMWSILLPIHLKGALKPCFTMGQRLSDFLQLGIHSLSILRTETEEFLAVTFFVGKTVAITGAYTLHLHLKSDCAGLLIAAATAAKSKGWTNLFFPPTSTWEETRAIISATINRDVRCIRRGGLQRMALRGTPLLTILIFSRHATPAMLSRYLEHNRVLLAQARITADSVAISESSTVSGRIESL